MATKFLTAAALVLGLSFSTVTFAGNPKTDAKDAKAPAKVEAKTATTNDSKSSTQLADLYWFDANNGTPITGNPQPSAGCSGTGDPCANGYTAEQVGNNPNQEPSVTPTSTELGSRANL